MRLSYAGLAAGLVALSQPAGVGPTDAQPSRSTAAYTPLDRNCIIAERMPNGHYARLSCRGYGGVPVDIVIFDGRYLVSYPTAACSDRIIQGFNSLGPRIEWRIRQGRPFAAILRQHMQVAPSRYEDWLQVGKIGDRSSCSVAYVSGALAHANAVARQIADGPYERNFRCESDLPRIVGATQIPRDEFLVPRSFWGHALCTPPRPPARSIRIRRTAAP